MYTARESISGTDSSIPDSVVDLGHYRAPPLRGGVERAVDVEGVLEDDGEEEGEDEDDDEEGVHLGWKKAVRSLPLRPGARPRRW